jgi:hypothetical protein
MRKLSQFSVLSALLFCIIAAVALADSPATMPSTMPDSAAAGSTTAPTTINWDQAKDHIGQTVTVIGPVVGAHDFGDAAVLNVGKDFPDAGRFTVYIPADKRTGMASDLDNGKTISVTGTLKMFKDVPEIEAGSADITVVKQADAPATTSP